MSDIQRFWHTILNIVIGGMALTAVFISYGRASQPDALYFYIVGLITWIFGLGVFISKPDDRIARLSYLMSVGLMSVCSVDATFSPAEQGWQAKFVPLFQFAVAGLLPCVFLRCFAIFPSVKRFAMNRFFKWWVYAPGVIISIAMYISYLAGNSYERLPFLINIRPLLIPNLICLMIYSLAAHLCLLHTWLSGETLTQRKQAKWLFLGIGIGTIPVFFLYTIPSICGIELPYGRFSAYTLIMIPVCYGVAILRHRLLDIELALNRSSVYAVVSSLLLVIYLISVRIFSAIFPGSGIEIGLFSTLIVALLFAPMKRRIQEFIDKYFHQRRYNYRQTLLSLSETLSTMLSLDKLGETLLNQLDGVLQPEFAALLLKSGYAARSTWGDSEYVVYRQIGDEERLREVPKELDLESIMSEPERIGERKLAIPLLSKGESVGFILLGGKLSGANYNAEDISLMKTLSHQTAISIENAQRKHEAELMQAAKMESLRQLVAAVAHTFGQSVGTIISNSDISGRAIDKIKRVIKDLRGIEGGKQLAILFTHLETMSKGIQDAAVVVEDIVTNLKDYVELDKSEWQFADINEGIDNVITLMGSEFSGQISVTRDYGDTPKIYCSPRDLKQVYMSMLRNACEAIDGEGEVHFRTCVQEKRIKIEISDTGTGIPAKDMLRIFDPGFTTKGVKVGMGLGLSNCYKIIVDEHRGHIDVSSTLGKGTTFIITLPQLHDGTERTQ